MYFYMNYRNVEVGTVGLLNALQMGNLGYSSSLCRDVHLGVGKITLTCETGVIKDIVAFGIIPEHAKIQDACLPNEETQACDEIINENEAIEFIEKICISQEICSFEIVKLIKTNPQKKPQCFSEDSRFYIQVLCKAGNEEEIQNRKTIQTILVWTTILTAIVYYIAFEVLDRIAESKLEEYDQLTTTCSDFTAIYKIPEELFQDFKENVYPKYNEELYMKIGRTFPLINAFKYYMKEGFEKILAENESAPTIEHRLDSKRISAENQRLEFDYEIDSDNKNEATHRLTPQNVDNVIGKWRREMRLKEYKTQNSENNAIQRYRSKTPQEQSHCPSTLNEFFCNRSKEFKIAEIHFSFKNREILHLLEKRGDAILEGDHNLKLSIQNQIDNLIKDKHEIFTTPVVAFITFENEESYLKATEINKVTICFNEHYKKYWQGHPLYFKPALEPSSILWENQYVPKSEKLWKLLVVFLVITLILFTSFCLLFKAQKEIYDYMNIYPYIDCDSVTKIYGDSLQHYGVLEWVYITKPKPL